MLLDPFPFELLMTLLRSVNNQHGLTLMTVLFMVTVVGLVAGITGASWKTLMQQTREEELLWRGDQYRKAIGSYYRYAAGQGQGQGGYPNTLEDLLKDPRSPQAVRHIRHLYPDPMTGMEWVLIKDPGGRITGVRSSSDLEPFKKDNFSEADKKFKGAKKYSAWEFVYASTNVSAVKSSSGTTTGGTTSSDTTSGDTTSSGSTSRGHYLEVPTGGY